MKQLSFYCQFCSQLLSQSTSSFYFCHNCSVGFVIDMRHQVRSIEFPVAANQYRLIANVAKQKLSLVDMDPSHEYSSLMDRYIITVDYIPSDLSPATNDKWVDKLLNLMVFS